MGLGEKFKLSTLNADAKHMLDKIPMHSAPADLVEKQADAWVSYLDAAASQRGFSSPPSTTVAGKSYANLMPREFLQKAVENKQSGVVLRHFASNGSKDIEKAIASKYLERTGLADDREVAQQLHMHNVPSDVKAMALHLWMVGSNGKFGPNDKDFSYRKVEQKIDANEDTLSLAQKGFVALDQSVTTAGVKPALDFKSMGPRLQFLESEPALQPFRNKWNPAPIAPPVPAPRNSGVPNRKPLT